MGLVVVDMAPAQEATVPSSATADSSATQEQESTQESTVPQRDVIDVLNEWVFGRRIEPKLEGSTRTGLAWSILPTLSYNPVYGFAFGASATGAGIRGSNSSALRPPSPPDCVMTMLLLTPVCSPLSIR